jgi:hypothetical protein
MRTLLLVTLLFTSCTSGASSFELLPSQNGAHVSLTGALYSERLPGSDYYHLCPRKSAVPNYAHCIDLVVPKAVRASLPQDQGACKVLSGKFNAFGPNRVGLGWFRSNIGYIEVEGTSYCNGR